MYHLFELIHLIKLVRVSLLDYLIRLSTTTHKKYESVYSIDVIPKCIRDAEIWGEMMQTL